jgi:uncharacterized protein (UPF0248 family)
MPDIRDILNEIKWTKNLEKVEIWYIHRGALNNTKIISGIEITTIGRSFLETTTATIPYHRIIKILYADKTIFDRWKFDLKDKQL